MRRWILGCWIGSFALALAAVPAGAERYNLSCGAGPDGDAHENNADADVAASFSRDEMTGSESYQCSASTAGGTILAKAVRAGTLSPGTTSAAANLEETIHIDEVPSGPIDIYATLGVDVSAAAIAGFGAFATANASLRLNGGTGDCNVGFFAHSVQGDQPLAGCSAPDSEASGNTVRLRMTPQQLINSAYQIDLFLNAEAKFEGNLANLKEGSASASGGAGFAGLARSPRGSEPIPGTVYIEIEPPTAHSYTGSQTAFPVPEPGAPLLAAVGAAVLAVCRRRA